MYKLKYIAACAMLFLGVSAQAQQFKLPKTANNLHQLFKYSPNRAPMLFAHRGGIVAGLPENSLAIYAHTVKHITPFLEVDPRLTKDSVIVILHDATLDRTTTGKGKLSDHTFAEIQALRLKDEKGNVTDHRIPTLEETIKWAKGKAILMLDRKDVPIPMIARKLKEWNAASQVIVSAFQLADAKAYYEQNTDLMMEVYAKDDAQIAAIEEAGIPWRNIIAYVSQPKKKEHYDALHARGVMAMVYTATVIEKKAEDVRKQAYKDIINTGGDIILADRVEEVGSVIKGLTVGGGR